jgi:mono/diheme cytochrome c family protein
MSSPETQSVSNPAPDSQAKGPVVPIWLIVVTFMLLYWGAVYFDANGGWFNPKIYAPFHDENEVALLQPSKGGAAEWFEFGKSVYNKPTCSTCHQPNGQGTAGQFPPLAGTDWVLEPEPGRIIRAVLHGMQGGPIKINGQSFSYSATMVPWKDTLKDDEIAAVLTYIRQDWGNKAPPVTTEQVKAVRDKTKSRTTAYTPDELMQVSQAD